MVSILYDHVCNMAWTAFTEPENTGTLSLHHLSCALGKVIFACVVNVCFLRLLFVNIIYNDLLLVIIKYNVLL